MSTPSSVSPRLVGLVGLKRSGKDTAARGLVEQLGWQRMAFADPLKEMSLRLRGVRVEVPVRARMASAVPLRRFEQYYCVIEGLGMEAAKDLVPDVRTLLQTLGTDCVRGTFGARAWMDLTGDRVRHGLDTGERIVVTDVRFAEEMNLVRELGGVTVGIWRGAVDELDRALRTRTRSTSDDHPSETTTYELLPQVDHLVVNNGSTKDLQRAVVGFVMGS